MAICRNPGCTNFVIVEGLECFSCQNRTLYQTFKPIDLPPIIYCSRPGCFNIVSHSGDLCSSCRFTSTFESDSSYLTKNKPYQKINYNHIDIDDDDDDDDDDDIDELFDRAKAAYRREYDGERKRIRRNKGYAYDWVQSVIGFLTAILNFFSTVWASCCYISTAVFRHYGLPDDCYYLKVLRRFRDEYIIYNGNKERISDLEHYYKIAPSVVNWIDAQPNADVIWADIANTITESVKAIESKDYKRAYELYKTKILNIHGYDYTEVRLHESRSK
jgi:hypothetical protein